MFPISCVDFMLLCSCPSTAVGGDGAVLVVDVFDVLAVRFLFFPIDVVCMCFSVCVVLCVLFLCVLSGVWWLLLCFPSCFPSLF